MLFKTKTALSLLAIGAAAASGYCVACKGKEKVVDDSQAVS